MPKKDVFLVKKSKSIYFLSHFYSIFHLFAINFFWVYAQALKKRKFLAIKYIKKWQKNGLFLISAKTAKNGKSEKTRIF